MNLTTAFFMVISVLPYLPIYCVPNIHEDIHVFVARMLGDKTAHIIDGNKTCTSLVGKKRCVVALSPYLVGYLLANILGIALVFRSSPACFLFLEIILVALFFVGIMGSPRDRRVILRI
jgi:hypothetical protein